MSLYPYPDPVVGNKVTFGRSKVCRILRLPLEKSELDATETAEKLLAWASRHDAVTIKFDPEAKEYRVHITRCFPVTEKVEPPDA